MKNSAGDRMVLSDTEYERFRGKDELHLTLDEGLVAMDAGQSKPAAEVFAELEKRLGIEINE